MTNQVLTPHICIIGGGSAGLSVAAGAAQMGADVVLLEGGKMGGDCLNYGCVPSKAILAAAKSAKAVRKASAFGVNASIDTIDFQAVHDHIKGTIATIEPHDSPERFESLGVKVILQKGKFASPTEVVAEDGTIIRAKRFVVSTGSRAFVPPIPGIDTVDYMTNETVFEQTQAPKHLIVLGGGPIGCEMAYAHRHLGSEVTLIDLGTIMPRDDQEAVAVVREQLLEDGITLLEKAQVKSIAKGGDGVQITIELDGKEQVVSGSHLLAATGRMANVNGLELEKAGIEYDRRGIKVGPNLKSTNPRVFALGDMAAGPQFTHVAGYHASLFIRQVLFKQSAKTDYSALPWVTYVDPELAQVGLTEAEAKKQGLDVTTVKWDFAEMDRAIAENATKGFVKVVINKKGIPVGATMVGKGAGEMIQPWILAISTKLKMAKMAQHIAPYPTLSEINKRAAGSFFTPRLFSDKTRRLVRFLLRF